MSELTALVTGSSSGLGEEICHYLLDNDYTVFGASRSGADIEHGNYEDFLVDIRNEGQVEEMFNAIEEFTDGLDLIVLNAGVFQISPLHETSSKEFSEHLNTNTLGAFHILKHAYGFLKEEESHVIAISSIAAKRGFEGVSAYCSSKFGLNGLIESCREEWKSLGVRFTTLVPGAIDTPLWDKMDEDFERDQMLSVDDFLHVFDMVVGSSGNVQFPEINFMHKNGIID